MVGCWSFGSIPGFYYVGSARACFTTQMLIAVQVAAAAAALPPLLHEVASFTAASQFSMLATRIRLKIKSSMAEELGKLTPLLHASPQPAATVVDR